MPKFQSNGLALAAMLAGSLGLAACVQPPKPGDYRTKPKPTAADGSTKPADTGPKATDKDPAKDPASNPNTGAGSGTTMGQGTKPEPKDPLPEPEPEPKPDPKPLEPKPADPTTLTECPNGLSIGRFQKWIPTTEGQMEPSSETILRKEGDRVVGKVRFIGNEWHVLPIWLKNQFGGEVDLSQAQGFSLTYSATDAFYIQMRPGEPRWSGGNKWGTMLPGTGGQIKTQRVSLEASAWATIPGLDPAPYPYAEARKAASGFVIVGKTPNELTFTGLSIDGFTPPCL